MPAIQLNMKKNTLLSCLTGFVILLSTVLSNAQTVFVVTDSTDSNTPGKLRYAINQANLNPGASIIKFNIPSVGTNPINLVVSTTLPPITKTVCIDGTTQPGYSSGNSRIRIVGTNSPNTLLSGLVFNAAPGSKLIGVSVLGFYTGVSIKFSDNCEVRNCSIYKCDDTALELEASSYCIIKGNTINTDKTGTDMYAGAPTNYNATEGISLKSGGTTGSSYNMIGGQGCDEGNTICFTKSEGIDNAPPTPGLNIGNRFSGNKIYSNAYEAIFLRSAANGNISPPVITTTPPASCILSGTSSTPYGIVEVFNTTKGTTDNRSARLFLGSTTANASGAWTVSLGFVPDTAVTATISDPVTGNTSGLANAVPIVPSSFSVPSPVPGGVEGSSCLGKELTFVPVANNTCNPKIVWEFGDGSPVTEFSTHLYPATGYYLAKATVYSLSGCASGLSTVGINISDICPPPCENCIGSFAPEAGEYLFSAWVKKETASLADTGYTTPRARISFPSSGTPTVDVYTSGRIIDGWQRMERQFTVPVPSVSGATTIKIELECLAGTGNCLFDDIRIFPFNGSMKSYVYDPVTKKLVAELDERNYSTFYEYDEEGKLVRVKKETEKGIMTIKENRDSSTKR